MYLSSKHLSVKAFEKACGLSNGAVSKMGDNTRRSTIDKISTIFPDLNPAWLLTGEGQMLREQSGVTTQNVHHVSNTIVAGGNNSGNVMAGAVSAQAVSYAKQVKAPVVPRPITRVQNLDVLEYVRSQGSGIEMSKVIIEDVPVSCWYNVENSALAPRFMLGDMVALTSISIGMGKIVPGYVYAVDTKSMGMLLRILFEDGGLLRAHSLNPDEYPDFTIEPSDVIRTYRVMGMVRYNA